MTGGFGLFVEQSFHDCRHLVHGPHHRAQLLGLGQGNLYIIIARADGLGLLLHIVQGNQQVAQGKVAQQNQGYCGRQKPHKAAYDDFP